MINSSSVAFKNNDLREIRIKRGESKIPLKVYQICAGRSNINFEDREMNTLDLRSLLIKNERLTKLFQVVSDSLEPEIRRDDLLIIDRKIASNNLEKQLDDKIIACILDGESLVKRYKFDGRNGTLLSINPAHEPIVINDFQYFQIWGVTTFLLRKSRNFILDNPLKNIYNGLEELEEILNNYDLEIEEKLRKADRLIKKLKRSQF